MIVSEISGAKLKLKFEICFAEIMKGFCAKLYAAAKKYFFWSHNETFTRLIKTGTSTRGPITAANASPELIPKTAIATAIASSKLLLAAVKDSVAVFEYPAPIFFPK